MIIRSQDKKTLTNFAQVTNLAVKARKDEFEIRVYYPFSVGDEYSNMCLGTYSTEERAIKVLDMIQDAYLRTTEFVLDGIITASTTLPRAVVFQMPQF